MKSRILDSNIVSYLFKRDSRAELYRPHLTDAVLGVSLMTVAELDRWAAEHAWGEARKVRMARHLERFVILPIDRDLCVSWAEVHAGLRRKGRAISDADAWIAAAALIRDVPLVTHNRKHFDAVDGLELISEAPA